MKSSSSAITTPAPFEDFAVARGADESDRPFQRAKRLDSRFAAGRDEIISAARKSDPGELPIDRIGGARGIGQKHHAAPLLPPLPEPRFGARVEMHAVVNDAPYVAQNQPVPGI